jgi:hypothetical protein
MAYIRGLAQKEQRVLPLAQRCLALYDMRWRAGTLFTLTLAERVYFADRDVPRQSPAESFLFCAKDAVVFWPPLRTPAEEEARLRGVCGALRAALEMDARDDLQVRECAASALNGISTRLLADTTLLDRLRTTGGLTEAEVKAAFALAKRDTSRIERVAAQSMGKMRESAAADVARHGLRRCTLPSCGITEPHPKLFKLCGRCRNLILRPPKLAAVRDLQLA